ncbi:MAG: hypothetical protein ACLU4S_12420, partial [Clostridium perfringens]
YCLMHEHLKEHKENTEHIKILAGLYLSSLLSCWETFFRDVVAFIIEIDVKFISKVEDCFTIFPQLISVWVAKKYNQNLFVVNINSGFMRLTNELNDFENILILTKGDFTAEYEIVE